MESTGGLDILAVAKEETSTKTDYMANMADNVTSTVAGDDGKSPSEGQILVPPLAFFGLFVIGKCDLRFCKIART